MFKNNHLPRKTFTLRKDFSFDSAHVLKGDEGHCGQIHGHTWTGTVVCQGNSNQLEDGILTDFREIKRIIKQLDHCILNEVLACERPTAEYIAAWILEQIPFAVEVILNESPGSQVRVTHQK